MKKIFIPLLFLPVASIAQPKIEVESDSIKNAETVYIQYDDGSKFNKYLSLSLDLNAILISKSSKERKYFKCYDKFEFLVDGKALKLADLGLVSNGGRPYYEDAGIEGENLAKLVNKEKVFDETFHLFLTKTNLQALQDAQRISINVCGNTEDFLPEEVNAFKQAVSSKLGGEK